MDGPRKSHAAVPTHISAKSSLNYVYLGANSDGGGTIMILRDGNASIH